jgi:hypothetical protein
MPSVDELSGAGAKSQLGASQAEAVRVISENQQVIFTKYIRMVLPLDGFVFWVRADLVNPSALLAVPYTLFNQSTFENVVFPATGSLHYMTDQQQTPDENFAYNKVLFTSEVPLEPLNSLDREVTYIGTFQKIRFAFSRRQSFYQQASQWHYEGDAVYPVMETQIIDSVEQLNLRDVVVSNSLPIWLALNKIAPTYPAMLLPDNMPAPYIAVDVQRTSALQMAPLLDETLSHYQLSVDRVRISTYGLRNAQAMDFIDLVNRYTIEDGAMGIWGDLPIPKDEKRQQNELNILAQKKTIDYDVTYYQNSVRDVARQFIRSCVPTFLIGDL